MKDIINGQREYFNTNITKTLKFRVNNLRKLKTLIKANEEAILDALNKDLGKSNTEAFVSEVGILYQEINHMIKALPKLMKIKKVKTPLLLYPAKCFTIREPYGVCLIISPWNYPFQLTIAPLIGAIAGGNCAIIKPSEYSTHTSDLIYNLLTKNFSMEYIYVIKGGVAETEALLNEKFDYIFFTGSVAVGKIIMGKAAKYLTPVTLELGGKSPGIIHHDANIDLASRKIVFGKLLNSGQTCVAPDYLIVHNEVKTKLVESIIKYIEKFYPTPLENAYYPKIINKRHFTRLIQLIENKKILYGGNYDIESFKIQPTLVDGVSLDDDIMNEEIFGPILPIITYDDISEVVKIVRSKEKPLALYLFTIDKDIMDKIINEISFGGGCINDTLLHLTTPYLPFGGVGESGMGSYHGISSFTTFTHEKSIINKGKHFDISLRYPPYTEEKLKLIKKIFK